MKKTFLVFFLQIICLSMYAQIITLHSNGYTSTFKKVDTLFFNEYAGTKLQINKAAISDKLMQLDRSLGIIARTIDELVTVDNVIGSSKKILSTPFYAYTDGTLQAPTSALFFTPKNTSTVVNDFSRYGTIAAHPVFKGSYYIYLNTDLYNTGDKILALCNELYNKGLAQTIEPVFIRQTTLHTDPLLPKEWNITNTGQYGGTPGADMKVADVWTQGYTGTGVKVAVIDLGVDLNHPDLQANLLLGYDATGNGSGGGPKYDAYNYHGTNCAGVIAEVQNSIGGVGVAYNAKIIPIRYGIGYIDLISGDLHVATNDTWESNSFNYAVNNGADIISNSWSNGSPSAQLDAAIQNAVTKGRGGKGAIVLFSTGNNNSAVHHPAINANVIAVGASSECDTRKRSSDNPALVTSGVSPDPLGVSCDEEFWWGSNYGTNLDVIAPGVYITTTRLPSGTDYSNAYMNDFYGTSAACPNVAGVMALILSANPNLTGQQARNILESTCDKVGGYTYQSGVPGQPNGTWSDDAGYGRINAATAVCKALTSNLTITGNASVCTNATYTINAPIGSTVTWSATPVGIVTLAPSGNSVVTTKAANGSVTITANVTGVCAGITVAPIIKKINVGTPAYPNVTQFANSCLGGTDWELGLQASSTDPSTSQYIWSKNGTPGAATTSPTYYTYVFPSSCMTIGVRAGNACGFGEENLMPFCSPCSGVVVSPNPAKEQLNVTLTDAFLGKQKTNEDIIFKMYELNSSILLRQWHFKNNQKVYSLNLTGIHKGNFILEITNGHQKESKHILIQE